MFLNSQRKEISRSNLDEKEPASSKIIETVVCQIIRGTYDSSTYSELFDLIQFRKYSVHNIEAGT